MELTKDDYDILIDLVESEMESLRLTAWRHTYNDLKRLRDTLIFIRDKESFNEN